MIAIHERKGSFSDRWIEYCKVNNLDYKIVNSYDSDIIYQLKGCNIFLWHWHHSKNCDNIFAKDLIYAIEQMGIKTYPNIDTCIHFDNKIAQKYLLESLNVPFIETNVFYAEESAKNWINNAHFPKVFKLKGGAGASNVKLVNNKNEALKLLKQLFSKGISSKNRYYHFNEALYNIKRKFTFYNFKQLLIGFIRFFLPERIEKKYSFQNATIEKNYIYFQDFIPNNEYDIRVITIGEKAFAIKRMNRKNDFKASGSGMIIYNKDEIPLDCIRLAFETSDKTKMQSCAYDFVFDKNNNPLIIEISYGFSHKGYRSCQGFWDKNLYWHDKKDFYKWNESEFYPEDMILDYIK